MPDEHARNVWNIMQFQMIFARFTVCIDVFVRKILNESTASAANYFAMCQMSYWTAQN